MKGGFTSEPDRTPNRPHSRSPGSIVFWGSQIAFSDWILRVAEAESGGMDVIRVDTLKGLDAHDGTQRFVFFDDAAGSEILGDNSLDLKLAGSIRSVFAYRNESLARQLLARRREVMGGAGLGFLPMDLTIDVWTPMFRLALLGDFVVHGRLLDLVSVPAPHAEPMRAENGALTPRETEVLGLVAQGMRNKTIAHQLGLSEHTIKLHLHNLISKIGVHNRTQAAQWFVKYSRNGSR
ncbi:helix-turn-helix transcriptional regulator [Pseudotabrizicola formosa]|uniref:helix-turn-helix transcriptional regulator n=1 Tax=Pseudotabrizicola formosa TaxID=2030009 RepID=UPI001FEEA8DE|nr:response regulator transcription factor [Pseudotabrizicola formosa]